jgi:hypothetical protein
MAISVENANLVWQKVAIALDSLGANKAVREQFRALKNYLAQEKNIQNLQFVAVSDLTADTVIADAACKLYGVFFKKQATSTAATAKLNDSATTAGGANGADQTIALELNASGQQVALTYPAGQAMASGIAAASQTNAAGNTDSTTGDGPNGFIILGAA